MKKKTLSNNYSTEGIAAKMRRWHQANPRATLTEIEEVIDREWAELRQEIVEELLQEAPVAEEARTECPQCGEGMVRNGKKKRQLTMKGGKRVTFEREQQRCHQCGMTLFPPG